MEEIIFVGIPGTGKSSFFKHAFFNTHVRISLDLLKTRFRERKLMEFCLATEQRFAIDNTNPTKQERSLYIEVAKAVGFTVVGYYFESKVSDCLRRNSMRSDVDRVPDVAVLSAAKKLELPSLDEGFDRLFYVRMGESGFVVEGWRDDI